MSDYLISRQDAPDRNVGDLISRQDAIIAVRSHRIDIDDPKKIVRKSYEDVIRELPSAQPEPKEADSGSITCMKSENTHVRTTDDCIRRQDAIEAVSGGMCSGWDCDVIDKLKAVPSADPDRKKGHWINEGRFANYHGGNVYRCSRCGNHIIEKEPDDFCKYCGSDNRGRRE